MVKFGSKDDPRFVQIWQPLRQLIRRIKERVEWSSQNGDMKLPNDLFVGRSKLIGWLDELVKKRPVPKEGSDDEPHVVALVGVGGVGKSQLALQYAELHRDDFANIFLFDSSASDTLESGIRKACLKLRKDRGWKEKDWTPSESLDPLAQSVFVRTYFEKTRRAWLVILDNYDDVEDFDIRKVMPKGPTGCVIITSRFRDPDAYGNPSLLEVTPMKEEEALELLKDRLFRTPTQIYQRQWVEAHAKKLVYRLGYLPLAIEMAAAYITQAHSNTSLEAFVKIFDTEEKGIYQQTLYSLVYRKVAKSDQGREVSRSIMATFDLQLKYLQQHEIDSVRKKALEYLEIAGFLDRNRLDATFFDRTKTALLCTDNDKWVTQSRRATAITKAFKELAKNSLSTEVPLDEAKTTVPQLRLHTAISEWIRMRQPTLEAGQGVFRKAARMINFHLRRCDHDDIMSCNNSLNSATVQHIISLMKNDQDFNTAGDGILETPENRLGQGTLLAATIRFAGYMQDMGHPDRAESLYNLVIERTKEPEDPRDPRKLHLLDAREGLAIVKLWKGDFDDAYRLCELCKEENEAHELRGPAHRTTLRTYHNLGEILCARKDFAKAIKVFEKALTIAKIHDEEDGLGARDEDGKKLEWSEDSLREQEALGNAYRCDGKLDKAHKKVKKALDYLVNKKPDSDLCFSTHESFALVLKAQEKFNEALGHYETAIKGYKETVGEYQHGTLGAMEGQADAMRRAGQFDLARKNLRSIWRLRREINGPDSAHFRRVQRALELVPEEGEGSRARFDELEQYSFPWPRPVYAAEDPTEDAADKDDDWT